MREVYIIDAVRTPIGKYKGALKISDQMISSTRFKRFSEKK